MNYSKNYFKLFANCIPVKGSKKSLIYDFQRVSFYEIENQLFNLFPIIENISLEEIKNTSAEAFKSIQELECNELGLFTETPELFPNLSNQWEIPKLISSAVVEYTNNLDFNIIKLFKDIRSLDCHDLVLILLNTPSDKELIVLLEELKLNEFYYIELWFIQKPSIFFVRKIINNYSFIRTIKIFNSTRKIKKIKKATIKYYEYSSPKEFCRKEPCPIIINYDFYCESLNFNNCINRKLAINHLGEIMNCLYINRTFGNYQTSDLLKSVKSKEFQELWHISKDKLKVCNACEYRYACMDCRAFVEDVNDPNSKPINCYKTNEKI